MKYCPFCGYKVENSYSYCPKCGGEISDVEPSQRPPRREPERTYTPHEHYQAWRDEPVSAETGRQGYDYYRDRYPAASDVYRGNGGFGWWILGFIFPLAGLILYLCLKKTRPGAAKSAGSGAFIMLIVLAAATAALMYLVLVKKVAFV